MLATVRSEAVRGQVAALGAEVIAPEDLVARAEERGGADVVLELVGAPNLESDFGALAMKGRIVIVGTGAGADAALSLRALMGKRARLIGTMLRARPLEEKAAAVQAFAREVVPHLASGRIVPLVDRVFPAERGTGCVRPDAGAGQARQGLLDFGA